MIRIDRDDFDEWRAHAVTERLFRALEVECRRIKETWCEVSLGGGRNDPAELAEFRTRLRVYQEIMGVRPEWIEEILNEQDSKEG